MDKKFYLNRKMNVNLAAAWFWTSIARFTNRIVSYASKKAQRHVSRNIYLAHLMERENYSQSFQNQLVNISKEFGHS